MEKNNVSVLGTNPTGAASDVSLLPYSAPELHVYNQAKTTMGGTTTNTADWIGPFTSYKIS